MGYVRHRSLLPIGQPLTVEAAVRSAGVKDAGPLSWESLSASATLVTTLCGAPIRTIVTGRRVITTGVYASRKAGRPLPYESMNELAFFMHCEVDTEVADYRAHLGEQATTVSAPSTTISIDRPPLAKAARRSQRSPAQGDGFCIRACLAPQAAPSLGSTANARSRRRVLVESETERR